MNEQKINKSAIVTRLVIWSVVSLLLISVFIAAMIDSGSSGWNIGGIMFVKNEIYKDADSYNVGNKTYTDEIKNLDIHWTSGEINIVIREGDKVEIKESGAGDDEDFEMRSKIIGDTLDIRFVKSGLRTWHIPDKKLTVYIPPSVAMSLEKIDVKIVSADVTVGNEDSKSSIAFSCDKLNVESVSGDVQIFGMYAKELTTHAVSAKCVFSGKADKINIERVSGNVSLTLANTPNKIDIETVSGSINLTLPESEEGFEAEHDAVSGKMSLNSKKVGSYCTHGNGKAEFDFETVSGDVVIKTKKVSE